MIDLAYYKNINNIKILDIYIMFIIFIKLYLLLPII